MGHFMALAAPSAFYEAAFVKPRPLIFLSA